MLFFVLITLLALSAGTALVSLTTSREISSVSRPAVSPPPELPPTPAPEASSPKASSPKAASPGASRPVDMGELEDRLRRIASGHAGFYGVAVLDPASGKTATLNADETFGAASIGKLPALITLYHAAARGEVDLEDKVSIQRSDYQPGSGVLQNRP